MDRRRAAGTLLALAACIACAAAAPTTSDQTALDLYEGGAASEGCYYNFQHYGEGDRIMTNEPCLNCTCHNRMLMCYLRVCPFTKPIGQDCTVEKRADQCCPIVTCPDVPVDLLTSTSTTSPAEYGATGVGHLDKYGCNINGKFLPEGAKVPPAPNKPCEHCYCIRNMTTCVMQECTLHVDGCTPIYHKDVCCPVRYSCDHAEDEIPMLDDMTTTVRPTPGFLLTTTTLPSVTQDCVHDDQVYADGASIKTEKACEHCYCMKGDIVCVVQECGTPMENEGKNCTSSPPREGQCCPDTYICEGDNELPLDETTTSVPPRRAFVEGSGYRIEPDEINTEKPTLETEPEGSGHEEVTEPAHVPLTEDTYSTNVPKAQEGTSIELSPAAFDVTTSEPDKGENTVPNDMFDETTKTPQHSGDDAVTDSSHFPAPEQESELASTPSTQEKEVTPSSSLEDKFGVPSTEIPSEPSTINDLAPSTSAAGETQITTEQAIPSEQEGSKTITTAAVELEEPQSITTTAFEDEIPQAVTKASVEADKPQTTLATITTAVAEQEDSQSLTTVSVEKEGSQTTTAPSQEQEEIQTTTLSSVPKEEPEASTTLSVDTDSSQTTNAPLLVEQEPQVTTAAPIESQATTLPSTDRDESQTTIAPLLEEQEPRATTSASLEEEEPQATSSSVDISAAQTTAASLIEEQEPRATTSASLEEEEPQATTLTSVDVSAAQTTAAPSLEEQEAQSTTTASIEKEQPRITTVTSIEKEPSTATTESLIDQEQPEASTTPSIEREGAQTTIAPLLEVQEPQATTPASIEKDTLQTTIAPLIEEQETQATTQASVEASQTTTSPFLEETEPQATTIASVEKDEQEATTKTSIEKDGSQSTTTLLLEGQEPQVTTASLSEEKEPEVTTTVSVDRDVSQTTTSSLSVEQEPQVTTLSSVEKDGSQTTTSPLLEELEPQVTTESSVERDGSQTTTLPLLEELEPQVTTETSVERDGIQTTTAPLLEEQEPQVTTSAAVEIDDSQTTTAPMLEEQKPQVTTTATVETGSSQITTAPVSEEQEVQAATTILVDQEESQVTTTASIEKDGSQSTTAPSSEQQETLATSLGSVEKGSPEITTASLLDIQGSQFTTPTSLDITTKTVTEHEELATTAGTEKEESQATTAEPEISETTSVNPLENEIHIESTPVPPPGVIPGEGNCLINGETYVNDSKVPSLNKCESSCKCVSSIVKCEPVICSPLPTNMVNCRPVQDDDETCCPVYVCDDGKETIPPQPHSQVVGTDKPIICENDECKTPESTQPTTGTPPCLSDDCSGRDQDNVASDCGLEGCIIPDKSDTTLPTPDSDIKPPEVCLDGNCLSPPKACEGELCSQPVTPTKPCDQEGGCATEIPIEQLCDGLPCISEVTTTKTVCSGDECKNTASPVEPSEKLPTTESTDTTNKESCADGSDCQKESPQPLPEIECKDGSCTRKTINELGNKFGTGCAGSECTQGEDTPSSGAVPLVTELPEKEITPVTEPPISPEKEESSVIPSENTTPGYVTESSEFASTSPLETITKVTEIPVEQEVITENKLDVTDRPSTDKDLVTIEPSEGLTEQDAEQSSEPSVSTPGEGYIYAKPTGSDNSYTEQEATTKVDLPDEITQKSQEVEQEISTTPKPYESPVPESAVTLPVSIEGDRNQPDDSISTPSPQATSESEMMTPIIEDIGVTKETPDVTLTSDAMIQDEVFTTKSSPPEITSQSTFDETTKATSVKDQEDINTEVPSVSETEQPSTDVNIPKEGISSATDIPEIYTSGLPEETVTSTPIQPLKISSTTQAQEDASTDKDESIPSEATTTPSDKHDQTIPAEEVKTEEILSTTLATIDMTEVSNKDTFANQPEDSATVLPEIPSSPPGDKQDIPAATESSEQEPELPTTNIYPTDTPATFVTNPENIPTDTSVVEPHEVTKTPIETPSQTGVPESTEPQPTEKVSEEPQTESPQMQEQPDINDTRRHEGAIGTSTLEPEYIAVAVSSEAPASPIDETSSETVPEVTTDYVPTVELSTSVPKEEPNVTEVPALETTEGLEIETPKPTIDQEEVIPVSAVTGSQETSTEPQSYSEKVESPTEESVQQTTESTSQQSETTPYLVELEVHTHKTDEMISPDATESVIRPEQLTTSAPSFDVETSTYEDKQTTKVEIESPSTTAGSPLPTEIGDLGTKFGKPEDTPTEVPATEISVDTTEENLSVTDKQIELSTTTPVEGTTIPSTEKPETSPELSSHEVDMATTPTRLADEITQTPTEETTRTETKATEPSFTTASLDLSKPSSSGDDLPLPEEEASQFPPSAGPGGYGGEPDYVEEDQAFGPGTCRYGGKVYVSAQQIPRDDPCDFCFCFRSDIICLQQSCPPPIHGCHEEPIQGFCCPRYECPVSMATTMNVTTTTTTTTTTLPPHFLPHAYKGAAQRKGCQIKGHTYKVGEVVRASSGPCLTCTCGGDGQMKCDPKQCTPEPMLRQMIAAAVSSKRRR